MSIGGSGTAQDPYVIHNWDELLTAIDEADSYVTAADNVVINLLDIYPEGIPSSGHLLTFKCKQFDGNGIIIMQAYNLTPRSNNSELLYFDTTCDSVANINFVDMYVHLGTNALLKSARNTISFEMYHSTIKGILIVGTTGGYEPWTKVKRFFDCVFNLKYIFTSVSGCINNAGIFDSCWVRFDTNSRFEVSRDEGTFTNSYLEGHFQVKGNNLKVINLGNSINSVINAVCDADTWSGCTIYAKGGATQNLVNTSKFIGTVTPEGYSASNTPISVTDTQLKDETYLMNIFPVVPYTPPSAGGGE